MEKDKEKDMEVLLKNTIQEIGLEAPSSKFTEELLSRLQLADLKKTMPEKPLISRRTWGLLLAVITGLSAYLIFGIGTMDSTWDATYVEYLHWLVQYFDFTSNVHLSDTVMYSLASLTLFLCIQVLVLKHHFNNRHSL
jgi:hypothetical protein